MRSSTTPAILTARFAPLMEFRQLLPEMAAVEVTELLGSLDLGAGSASDRPHTIANFVVSVDGRATINGRSGPLGDDGDRAMFHGLRERADAVLVGTRTLGVERYGRILGREERRARRVERGQRPEPLATVITRSGEIPVDVPLFAEPEAQIVIFSSTEIELDSPAQVEVILLDPGEMTLTTAMRRLRTGYGVRMLLCEGGPTLFGALLDEGLVDELFLTVSPQLAGGGRGPTITSGPELPDPARLQILWLLERGGSLYLRYGVH